MARSPSPRTEAARQRAEPTPWLEEAEEEQPGGTLVGRGTLWTILLALALLVGGIAIGVFVMARQAPADIDAPPAGDVPLVRNPGPWKVAPDGPGTGGETVEGQGQILFGTGVGRDAEGAIALDSVAEEPLLVPGRGPVGPPTDLLPKGVTGAAPGAAGSGAVPAAAPAEGPVRAPPRPIDVVTPRAAPAPAAPAPATPAPASVEGTSTVQLGAFSSESRARAAWKSLEERFGYMAGLTPAIVPTTQDGRTLYRLRTTAADAARALDLCQRLKIAGEACAPAG